MTRGEADFVKLPAFAALLYSKLTSGNAVKKQFEEIAEYITSRLPLGKLLDVGTGPGFLLREIHELNKSIELYGIDISPSMVVLAKRNLHGTRANLKIGSIAKTDYPDCSFDLVTSTGSFYLWDSPRESLNEIHRILSPGKTAYIFETRSDYDAKRFNDSLRTNLEGESIVRRLLSPVFLKKQLRMTYTKSGMSELVKDSKFGNSYKANEIEIANLPIWICLELFKESQT